MVGSLGPPRSSSLSSDAFLHPVCFLLFLLSTFMFSHVIVMIHRRFPLVYVCHRASEVPAGKGTHTAQ